MNSQVHISKPAPFLRWAGGKTWLVKHVQESLKRINHQNYHEPFLGGAAIYLSLNSMKTAYLSDLNAELIDTYEVVKSNVGRLIAELHEYKNSKTFYYTAREVVPKSRIKRAARFIYLNQTSFNGIYRVNLAGSYNVPYGFRTKNFLDEENLRLVARRLEHAEFATGDFTLSLKKIRKGDLVFLDPPYTVSHNHNGFIKYNQKLFSLEDQFRLAEYIECISKMGAYFILTNAAHSKISEIFAHSGQRYEVTRASLIGGNNAKRGHISEYIFSNIPNLIL